MLIVIFLMFIALFMVSGVFISLEGKRRRAHSGFQSVPLTGSVRQRAGRAMAGKD